MLTPHIFTNLGHQFPGLPWVWEFLYPWEWGSDFPIGIHMGISIGIPFGILMGIPIPTATLGLTKYR